MANDLMKTTSIRLTDNEEMALNQLATKFRCHSRYGATSGQPSWRVMLQHIAEGRLIVSNPMDKTRKVFVNFKRPPGWWRPDEDGGMLAALVARNYKTTVEILEEKDFVLSGDRIFPGNWKNWQPRETKITPPAAKNDDLLAIAEATLPAVHPLMMEPPSWFARLPGMTAMPLAAAKTASRMEQSEMEAHGIRIKKISGNLYVTGPKNSEWDVDSDDATQSRAPTNSLSE